MTYQDFLIRKPFIESAIASAKKNGRHFVWIVEFAINGGDEFFQSYKEGKISLEELRNIFNHNKSRFAKMFLRTQYGERISADSGSYNKALIDFAVSRRIPLVIEDEPFES